MKSYLTRALAHLRIYAKDSPPASAKQTFTAKRKAEKARRLRNKKHCRRG